MHKVRLYDHGPARNVVTHFGADGQSPAAFCRQFMWHSRRRRCCIARRLGQHWPLPPMTIMHALHDIAQVTLGCGENNLQSVDALGRRQTYIMSLATSRIYSQNEDVPANHRLHFEGMD